MRLFCVVAALVVAGCSSQMPEAQQAISNIEAVLSAAPPDAARYVPEQVAAVRANVRKLRTAFDDHDYDAVLTGAPDVLRTAKGLPAAAAARKDEITRELNAQWAELAPGVQAHLNAIEARIDYLAAKAARKQPLEFDMDAAQSSYSRDVSLWSKAQAAFATGNLAEALATARSLDASLDELAGTLKMTLNATVEPAAVHR